MMRTDPGDANDLTTVQLRDPLVGTLLDQRFRIELQLAAGGFGAIYRATDVRGNVEVALKVLHPKLARDPNVIERFRREAATLSNLRNPHTIQAYDFGDTPDGTLFIAMELLHGESLYHQFHASGPIPWRRVVHIARGVCASLAEAHAHGIVHRDLKPANIHLETRDADTDFVKVLDFGIAKIVQGGGLERAELTQAGQMIGTIDYMSPEQMVGGEITGRSDIYSLGVLMFEMITGHMPYPDAQTATAILAAVLTRTPDPVSHHTPVPPALDEIVARCLERDAGKRYPEIGELDAALTKVAALGGRPAPAQLSLADRPTTAYVRQMPIESTDVLTSAVPVEPAPAPERMSPRSSDALSRAPAGSKPLDAVARDSWQRTEPARQDPVPSTGFEPSPTTEATRIDVRYTDSSEPVLDARGPRYRRPEEPMPVIQGTPGPAGAGHARGSQQAIETHGHGAGLAAPAAMAFVARPVQSPIPPPLRAGYPRSYDMLAHRSHDAIVRRILWVSVIAAVIIAIVIATH